MKILIVDDNNQNLYLLEAVLKSGGHESVKAGNGEEALEKMQKQAFDMIISDILMPKMDGFQFCIKCKSDQKLRNIPFIMATSSYTEAKDEEFALGLGADKFIVRPVEPDDLLKLVDDIAKQVKDKGPATQKKYEQKSAEFLQQYNERLIRQLEQKMMQLETDVKKRKKTEEELKSRMKEVETFNKSAVGRELKMIDLEKEINRLLKELGQEPKYKE